MFSDQAEKTYLPDQDILKRFSMTPYNKKSHSHERAIKYKLNKKKKAMVTKYTNTDIFIINLLNDKIKIIDIDMKNTINKHLDAYEKQISSLFKCENEKTLQDIVLDIESSINNLNNILNKGNFDYYVFKGFFLNKFDTNLRDTYKYKEKYKKHLEKTENKE